MCCRRGKGGELSQQGSTGSGYQSPCEVIDLKELRYCVHTFVSKGIPICCGERIQFSEERMTIESCTVPEIFRRFISCQQLGHSMETQV